jgi:hypothetical protein
MSNDIDKHMKALERRANVVRSRLLRTVDALDVRRHQVTEVGVRAKHAAPRIGGVVLGVAAASIGLVLGIHHWVQVRRERVLGYRVKRLLAQFRVERQPSFTAQLVQRLTFTIVTMVATEASRVAMKNLIDGRTPDGRLAVGSALDSHHEAMKG